MSSTAQSIKITNNHIFKKNGVQHLCGMVMKNTNAFIIAGSTNAALKLSTQGVTRGNWDYYVFETNQKYEIQWEQIYGSRYSDQLSSIIKNVDHLIFVSKTWDLGTKKVEIAGMESDESLGCRTRIINTNLEGDIIWGNTYKNVPGYSFSYDPKAALKTDGGYVVASQIKNDDTYTGDIRIFTISRNGNMEWDKKWVTDKDKSLIGIVESNDGGYVLTGYSHEGIGRDFTWVIKLSNTGQLVWNQKFTREKPYFNYITPGDIIKTSGGNYLIVGKYEDDYTHEAWVVMMDESRKVKWEHQYTVGEYSEATCVKETKDGGFLIGGISRKKEQPRVKQPWLIRTNDKGNKLYQVTFEAEQSATINNIITIDSKQFAIAGEIDEEAGFGEMPNIDIWFMILEEN